MNPSAVLPTASPPPSPTLAATGSPAPAAAPARTLQANRFAVITGTAGARLRVRPAPGTQQPIVARVAEGTVVKVLDGPAQVNGLQWWRIEVAGTSGWCAEPFLQPASPP